MYTRLFVILLFISCALGFLLKKANLSGGLQCYNCMSYDDPGCWDPKHPDYKNTSIPNVLCARDNIPHVCLTITAQKAILVENGENIGAVRVRTCVPTNGINEANDVTLRYSICEKISKELEYSEVFSKIRVKRPQCVLCDTPLCSV